LLPSNVTWYRVRNLRKFSRGESEPGGSLAVLSARLHRLADEDPDACIAVLAYIDKILAKRRRKSVGVPFSAIR